MARNQVAALLAISVFLLPGCSKSRYGDDQDVVLAEVLESNATSSDQPHEYPKDSLGNRQGANFLAAFLVDTTGHVDMKTVSFVRDAPAHLRGQVCKNLAGDIFRPVTRSGRLRRALVVRPFDFLPGGQSATVVTAGMRFDSTRAAIEAKGIHASLAELENRPHC